MTSPTASMRRAAGFLRGLGEVIRNWGSTEEERGEAFACDQYLEQPDTTVYRAVPVDANAHTTYLWLCQLRVAPYSYDWIDNGGRPSPPTRDLSLERLEIGQRFMTIFALVNFEADREVTVWHWSPVFGEAAATYRVVARDDSHCRIVVKLVLRYPPRSLGRPLMRLLLPAGDLLMMRRQLLNLADLATREWRGDRPSTSGGERTGRHEQADDQRADGPAVNGHGRPTAHRSAHRRLRSGRDRTGGGT